MEASSPSGHTAPAAGFHVTTILRVTTNLRDGLGFRASGDRLVRLVDCVTRERGRE